MTPAQSAALLKKLYDGQKVQHMTYEKNAFFAMMPKNEGFFGESYPQPITYANAQGRSQDFTKALAGRGAVSRNLKFDVTRSRDYQIVSIDGETIEATANEKGGFVSARAHELDGAVQNMGNTIDIDMFGSGSGSRGQLSATQNLALSTITLAVKSDIVKYEMDMKLVLSAADGGGTVKAGSMYVISVDRNAGTFVVSGTMGGAATALSTLIATAAVSDFIFVDGDYDSKLKGVSAWLPYGGPSATPFFGVDRTVDSVRLGGNWADLSALSIEEALTTGASQVALNGGKVDEIWINHSKYADLKNALGSKVQYVDREVIPGISFRGIELQCDDGVAQVYASRNQKFDRCFMLQKDTWCFKTLGGAPRVLNLDKLEALREADSDGIQIRMGYYGQLICKAPGFNGHFKI